MKMKKFLSLVFIRHFIRFSLATLLAYLDLSEIFKNHLF